MQDSVQSIAQAAPEETKNKMSIARKGKKQKR